MARAEFYVVEKSAYLFPDRSRRNDTREQPEEAVRQWCAYELIRYYGIKISDIVFEHAAKVGSKTYRIDILLLAEGKPWAVVECKEPSFSKTSQALEQAISYANAAGVDAEYAIYTNGNDWQVKRRIKDEWVFTADLPARTERYPGGQLTELLKTLRFSLPLLYKLEEPLRGAEAQAFLETLQQHFYGCTLLNCSVDDEIRIGLDNLLRVLSAVDEHPNYVVSKLSQARASFENYRQRAGIGFELPEFATPFVLRHEMQYLHVSICTLIEREEKLYGSDLKALRLTAVLFEYGRTLALDHSPYPVIPTNVHQALRDYLEFVFTLHLDAKLPDPTDHISTADIKEYSRVVWEESDRKNRITMGEVIRDIARAIFSRVTPKRRS